MTVTDYLTKGGIPDGATPQTLDWLAKAHRRLSKNKNTAERGVAIGWNGTTPSPRSDWHIRWAALIEDVLESRYG